MQRKLQFSIALAQKSPESWRYLWHADEYYSLFHVNELIHDLYLAEEMAEDSKHFNKAQWYCAALFCTELDGWMLQCRTATSSTQTTGSETSAHTALQDALFLSFALDQIRTAGLSSLLLGLGVMG